MNGPWGRFSAPMLLRQWNVPHGSSPSTGQGRSGPSQDNRGARTIPSRTHRFNQPVRLPDYKRPCSKVRPLRSPAASGTEPCVSPQPSPLQPCWPTSRWGAAARWPQTTPPPGLRASTGTGLGIQLGRLYGGIHVGYAGTTAKGLSNSDATARAVATSALGLGLSNAYQPINYYTTNYSDEEMTVGGFVGANWVWDDVILGLEADYITYWDKNQGIGTQNFGSHPASRLWRCNPAGHAVHLDPECWPLQAARRLRHGPFPALRNGWLCCRPGYVEQLLRLHLGRATNSAVVPFTGARKDGWLTGGTAGVGLDIALTDNVFVRTEYNYIGFSNFNGTTVTMHNIQAGIAFKY